MKKKIKFTSIKNKLLVLLTSFSIIFTCFSSDVMAEGGQFPRFYDEEPLGRASWSAQVHHGAVCYDKDNNPLLCFSTQGAYFFVVELETGKVRAQYDIIGSYVRADYIRCGPDNKVYVYFYPGFQFNVYDPIAETFEAFDMKELDPYVQDGGCMTDDGVIYMGEYNKEGASVYMYNTYTGEERKYGPLDKKCHYVKGVATDDKYIYAGTGVGAENAKMFRIDKETGEQTVFLENPGGGIVYTAYYINDKIIANTNSVFHFVDPVTLEKTGEIKTSHSRTGDLQVSPYNDKIFYHYKAKEIWECNTETLEERKICNSELTTALQWAKLKDGRWVLAMRTDPMEKVGYFDPQAGTVTSFDLDKIADAGPYVQCIEVGEDGLLYCGGYQTSMGIYNTNTNEFIASLPKWHQNEGTGFLNGKTYFGTYVDAVMYRYDPEKPMDDNYLSYNYDTKYRGYDVNPSMIYDIEDGQDRPFVVKSYRDKLYVGTMSNYAESGGAFVIIEEEDGINPPKADVYRNIIKDHSITGITFKDNLAYISSTARNGLGTENPDTPCQIVVFDIDKKEVVKTVTPDFPEVGKTAKTIGEISIGPDGLLWAAIERDGYIFALNPETFECVKYVKLSPGFDRGALARPIYLRWGDNGFLYTTAGWNITVVNPETMEYKILAEKCNVMSLGQNDDIWYAHDAQGELFKIPINQYDRLTHFIKETERLKEEDYTKEEWLKLQDEINNAKVLGEDTDNKTIIKTINTIKALRDKKAVKPLENDTNIIFYGQNITFNEDTGVIKLYKDRTMAPYKAFLEMLGYEVEWNVKSGIIKAKKDGREISMTVNKNIYTINDKVVEFDVTPVVMSGRIYIPVRLIAEQSGYEVKWNENENKVEIIK
ncbi:MAG: copper amine oxidase N-terminal domain-containing protein [Ruminococcaceae bacterium]|nr:copper amine oxidase N-terminal domain-containing protein [Oscillospiraceae bacterium]